MTVTDARPFVQASFNDQPGFGFPGQLESGMAYVNNVTERPSTETIVFCGRGVAEKTVQNFDGNPPANTAPFTIAAVEAGTTVELLFGIVERPFTATQSFEDVDTISKAGFGAKNVVPVIPFGSKQRVLVVQDPILGAVTRRDPVYIMIDAANNFGLQLGEFANAAPATPAHALLVPNAIWYRSKTATASDPINTIILL